MENYEEIYNNGLSEFLTKMEEIKKQMVEEGEKIFRKSMKTYFDRNPEVEGICWTQYTPYFNDGEACVFYVNEVYPVTKDALQKLEIDNVFGINCPYDVESDEWDSPAGKELGHIFRNIPGDVFETMFGDHAIIVMDRNKIQVEEYSHE